MLRPVPFYYLRHGQTDWNREGRCQGQIDVPLSDHGEMQARNAAHLLRNEAIVSICVSPLRRARRTAEIVNEVLRLPLAVVDDLKEMSLGEMEGQIMPPGFHENWRDGVIVPRQSEPVEAFFDRTLSALNAVLERPGPILVVGHGGFYWGIERHTALVTSGALPNAVPVFHTPPGESGGWTRRALEGRAAT